VTLTIKSLESQIIYKVLGTIKTKGPKQDTFIIFIIRFDLYFSDDLDFSPDFFEYFTATYPILKGDPTLWCVSAWNDNGKNGMVEDDPGKI
jgi:hypothetical protein